MSKLLNVWAICLGWLLILGCSDGSEDRAEKSLNRGLNGDPETLHPHNQQSNQSAQVIRDIYEGLLIDDGSGMLQGGIAESFTVSSDGLLYEFKLRPDARWSNGRAIVGSEVVRSFQCLADPSTGSTNSSIVASVMNAREIISGRKSADSLGVSAPSDRIVRFRMANVDSVFPRLLTMPGASIVYTDSEFGEVCARDLDLAERVFSGAYKVAGREVGSMIKLTRNDEYWDAQRTSIESVTYHVVDPDMEIVRFRANEIDITANVPATYFRRLKKEFGTELRVSPFFGIYYIGINFADTRLGSDRNLRAALFHAIDREAIVEKVLARGEWAAHGVVHPMVSGYYSNKLSDLNPSKGWDSSEALRYLQDSKVYGHSNFSLNLLYNSGGGHEQIMLAIQSMWAKNLGISTNLRKEEWKVFLSNVNDGSETELFRLSWTADYNDAMAFLEIFESGHEQNLVNYDNADFDELINKARQELSIEKRSSLLRDAERILVTDYAVIPVYFYVAKHLVARRVKGWTDNPMDIHRTKDLQMIMSD